MEQWNLVKDLLLRKCFDIQTYVNDPIHWKQKIFICGASIWIASDLLVSLYQRRSHHQDKVIIGPTTYALKLLNSRASQIDLLQENNNKDSYFGIKSNLQFKSSHGLARNMLGGYLIGFFVGTSSLSICYSLMNAFEKKQPLISSISPWSLYVLSSCTFYTMEYLWAAIFHPNTVSFDSFMLYNHSEHFHIALMISAIEYLIESVLFPEIKILNNSNKMQLVGFGMVVIGQLFRTLAEFTAGISFTHIIANYKKKEHELITHGVYRYLRHPSYFGFFYWSIGTQLLLANPLSTVLFTFASWSFFKQRIPYEESQLISFFGDDYVQYRKKTFIGIPFI